MDGAQQLMSVLALVGTLAGALPAAKISDRSGRRKILACSRRERAWSAIKVELIPNTAPTAVLSSVPQSMSGTVVRSVRRR